MCNIVQHSKEHCQLVGDANLQTSMTHGSLGGWGEKSQGTWMTIYVQGPESQDSFLFLTVSWVSCCFPSIAQSCLTLCDPMDCSTPGRVIEKTNCHLQASFIQLGHILHYTHLFISLPILGSFPRSCIFKIRKGKGGQHLNFILGEQCKWSWQSLGLKNFQRDYPVGSVVKNSPCNAEDVGSVPGQGSRIPPPWRNWPTHHN